MFSWDVVLHVLTTVNCLSTSHHDLCIHHRLRRPIREISFWAEYSRVLFLLISYSHKIINLIVFTSALIARKYILTWHFLTFIFPFYFFSSLIFNFVLWTVHIFLRWLKSFFLYKVKYKQTQADTLHTSVRLVMSYYHLDIKIMQHEWYQHVSHKPKRSKNFHLYSNSEVQSKFYPGPFTRH